MKLLTANIIRLHPLYFTLAFLLIFSAIVWYVDRNLSEEKMDSQMEYLVHSVDNYIRGILQTKILDNLLGDSLTKYCFVDTTQTINLLGINPTDSTAIMKDLLVGYLKVRYSDEAVDTGFIDTAKIYIGAKQNIPFEKQVHTNPNGILAYPHYLIHNSFDSTLIVTNIEKKLNDSIEIFRKFNEYAGGNIRFFYFDVDDFGTGTKFIPIISPATNRKMQRHPDTGKGQTLLYANLVRYALYPLDAFMKGLFKHNINITIKNKWNNAYIYGDSIIENKLLQMKHAKQISVPINRGNQFFVTIVPNKEFPREWTFFPYVYIILFIISIVFHFTLLYFIAQIKKNENALSNTNNKLQIANKTKDKLFSIISHDLRNSIAAMANIVSVFDERFDIMQPDQAAKNISILVKYTAHVGKLLENLLQWSRINMGSIRLDAKTTSIKNIVASSFNDIGIQAENKNIRLEYQNNSTYDEVYCDADMINTVIRNLISNAIKFSESNTKITVVVNNYKDDTNSDKYLLITVKDQGIGIPQNVVQNLFQIDSDFTTKGTNDEVGTGLGLILVKDFIDKHQTIIWVESEVGKGTEFKFTIARYE